MDLTKLKELDKEEEIRVKTLLELSTKKYNLQKELEKAEADRAAKQLDLKKLQIEVVLLQLEVPVLENQEVVVKKSVLDLMRQISGRDREIERIQVRWQNNRVTLKNSKFSILIFNYVPRKFSKNSRG